MDVKRFVLPKPGEKTRTALDDMKDIAAKMGPRLLYVHTFASGVVTLKEADDEVIDEPVPWIGFDDPVTDDAVLRLYVPGRGDRSAKGSYVAIGPIQRTTVNDKTLAFRLWIQADWTSALKVMNAAGDVIFNVDTDAGDVTLVNPNTPVMNRQEQNNSDTATTTDTVNYSDAITMPLVLGAGTWDVSTEFGNLMSHSAPSTASARTTIDGVAGTAITQTVTTALDRRIVAGQTEFGVAGSRSINIKGQFKAGGAGTVGSDQPNIWAIARRAT